MGHTDPYSLSSRPGREGESWRAHGALTSCFQHMGLQNPQDERVRFMVEKGTWESGRFPNPVTGIQESRLILESISSCPEKNSDDGDTWLVPGFKREPVDSGRGRQGKSQTAQGSELHPSTYLGLLLPSHCASVSPFVKQGY